MRPHRGSWAVVKSAIAAARAAFYALSHPSGFILGVRPRCRVHVIFRRRRRRWGRRDRHSRHRAGGVDGVSTTAIVTLVDGRGRARRLGRRARAGIVPVSVLGGFDIAWWLRRKREGANGRGADDALGARRGGAGAWAGKALRGGLRERKEPGGAVGVLVENAHGVQLGGLDGLVEELGRPVDGARRRDGREQLALLDGGRRGQGAAAAEAARGEASSSEELTFGTVALTATRTPGGHAGSAASGRPRPVGAARLGRRHRSRVRRAGGTTTLRGGAGERHFRRAHCWRASSGAQRHFRVAAPPSS